MVGSGFLDTYPTFRRESTKGNFGVADQPPNDEPIPGL
jgi:hypothetical protein